MGAVARRDAVTRRSRDSRCRRRWEVLLSPHRSRLWSDQDTTVTVTKTGHRGRCDTGRARSFFASCAKQQCLVPRPSRRALSPSNWVAPTPVTARPFAWLISQLPDAFAPLTGSWEIVAGRLRPIGMGVHRRAALGDGVALSMPPGRSTGDGFGPISGSAGWPGHRSSSAAAGSSAPCSIPRPLLERTAGVGDLPRRGRGAARQTWRAPRH